MRGSWRFAAMGLVLAACAQPQTANRGFALLEAQDYPGAEAYFAEKLALQPNNPYHYLNLGVALQAQGRATEAGAAFQKAVELGQNAPIADVVTKGEVSQTRTTVGALAAHNLVKLGL